MIAHRHQLGMVLGLILTSAILLGQLYFQVNRAVAKTGDNYSANAITGRAINVLSALRLSYTITPEGRPLSGTALFKFIKYGDGQTGLSPIHTYTLPGTYRVTADWDCLNNAKVVKNDDLLGIIVVQQAPTPKPKPPLPKNSPPTAKALANKTSVKVGKTISFDGSGSSDPDGSISSYHWNFGDGQTSSGKNPNHSYSTGGRYTVTLKVTDNKGASDTSSITINVSENKAPVAKPKASKLTAFVGEKITFDAGDSYDPDGKIVSYVWSFTHINYNGSISYEDLENQNPTYQWYVPSKRDGKSIKFTCKLTVIDNEGATNSKEIYIEVKPLPFGIPTLELNSVSAAKSFKEQMFKQAGSEPSSVILPNITGVEVSNTPQLGTYISSEKLQELVKSRPFDVLLSKNAYHFHFKVTFNVRRPDGTVISFDDVKNKDTLTIKPTYSVSYSGKLVDNNGKVVSDKKFYNNQLSKGIFFKGLDTQRKTFTGTAIRKFVIDENRGTEGYVTINFDSSWDVEPFLYTFVVTPNNYSKTIKISPDYIYLDMKEGPTFVFGTEQDQSDLQYYHNYINDQFLKTTIKQYDMRRINQARLKYESDVGAMTINYMVNHPIESGVFIISVVDCVGGTKAGCVALMSEVTDISTDALIDNQLKAENLDSDAKNALIATKMTKKAIIGAINLKILAKNTPITIKLLKEGLVYGDVAMVPVETYVDETNDPTGKTVVTTYKTVKTGEKALKLITKVTKTLK